MLLRRELGGVWPRADIVVFAASSTSETRHLVGDDAPAALPEHAVVVNIARESMIGTRAQTTGFIGVAALAVTDPEPLPDGHPPWTEPRAPIPPHAANSGPEQLLGLCALVVGNLHRFFARGQELRGRVDVYAGY